MKFYPYSNIQSENLKPLLNSAKVLGFLSYILFLGAILIGVIGILSDTPKSYELSGGLQATMSAPGYTGPAILGIIWGAVSSVCLLAFSGLCAAVVSCEHKYTSTKE